MDGTRMTSEVEELKQKIKATWMSGDFGRIATSFESGAAQFVERLDLKPDMTVLDVACGTGNLAIPAACTGADVTGLDIVPDLIDQARKIADTLGVKARFDIGDAEAMPYRDESFNVVMSMFGAMFTPRPDVAAAELKRVCKPGGLITMANWTPSGFVGQMFKITGKYVTPPAGMISPVLWGDEAAVCERLSVGVTDLGLTRRTIDFVFPFGPADVVEHFREFYGPTLKAFGALDAETRPALRADLEELWTNNNTATDGTTLVAAEYLEVKAVREY